MNCPQTCGMHCTCHTRYAGSYITPKWMDKTSLLEQSQAIACEIEKHKQLYASVPARVASHIIDENQDEVAEVNENEQYTDEFYSLKKAPESPDKDGVVYNIPSLLVSNDGNYFAQAQEQYHFNAFTDHDLIVSHSEQPNVQRISLMSSHLCEYPRAMRGTARPDIKNIDSLAFRNHLRRGYEYALHHKTRRVSGGNMGIVKGDSSHGVKEAMRQHRFPGSDEKPTPPHLRSTLDCYIDPSKYMDSTRNEAELPTCVRQQACVRQPNYKRYLFAK